MPGWVSSGPTSPVDEVRLESDDVGVAPHDDIALGFCERLPHRRALAVAVAVLGQHVGRGDDPGTGRGRDLGRRVARMVVDHDDLVDEPATDDELLADDTRRWRRPSQPRRAPEGRPTRRDLPSLQSGRGGRTRRDGTRARPEGPTARWHVTHESECDSQRCGYLASMSVKVRVPTTLRTLTGGKSEVEVEGATLVEVIASLDARPPRVPRPPASTRTGCAASSTCSSPTTTSATSRASTRRCPTARRSSIIPAVAGG